MLGERAPSRGDDAGPPGAAGLLPRVLQPDRFDPHHQAPGSITAAAESQTIPFNPLTSAAAAFRDLIK